MVVIDTLARSFGDGDENKSQDMNAYITNLDRIGAALSKAGVATLTVTHTSKANRSAARGSSALRGATSVEFALKQAGKGNGGRVLLTCEKQKDAEPFAPMLLVRQVVKLDDGQTSCVLRAADDAEAAGAITDAPSLDLNSLAALRALDALDGKSKCGAWRKKAGLSTSKQSKAQDVLKDRGYVRATNEHGIFELTPAGTAAAVELSRSC